MRMNHRSLRICLFLLVLTNEDAAVAEKEPYVYVIYDANDDCGSAPVTIQAFVSDDDAVLNGRDSGTGKCADEGICIINPDHDYCQGINATKIGKTVFSVDDGGLVFQCDSSNTDGQCSFLDHCYRSSVYPACHFSVAVTSDLLANPSLVTNHNVSNYPELTKHVYQAFYSDPSCKAFVGMEGVLTDGLSVRKTIQDRTNLTCEESMACVFNPTGERCKGYGGTTGSVWINATILDERVVLCPYAHPGDCEWVPIQCQVDRNFPQCYSRWVTASDFFEDPAATFISADNLAAWPSNVFGRSKPTEAPLTSAYNKAFSTAGTSSVSSVPAKSSTGSCAIVVAAIAALLV